MGFITESNLFQVISGNREEFYSGMMNNDKILTRKTSPTIVERIGSKVLRIRKKLRHKKYGTTDDNEIHMAQAAQLFSILRCSRDYDNYDNDGTI